MYRYMCIYVIHFSAHHFSSQAARLPRLLRSHRTVKRFFFKIVGDGTKLLVIIVLTGLFLMFFAIINMQFFGYIEPKSQCRDFDNHFENFFLVWLHGSMVSGSKLHIFCTYSMSCSYICCMSHDFHLTGAAVDVPVGDAGGVEWADEWGHVPKPSVDRNQFLLHCSPPDCLLGMPSGLHTGFFLGGGGWLNPSKMYGMVHPSS